jgi:hypothetical protein
MATNKNSILARKEQFFRSLNVVCELHPDDGLIKRLKAFLIDDDAINIQFDFFKNSRHYDFYEKNDKQRMLLMNYESILEQALAGRGIRLANRYSLGTFENQVAIEKVLVFFYVFGDLLVRWITKSIGDSQKRLGQALWVTNTDSMRNEDEFKIILIPFDEIFYIEKLILPFIHECCHDIVDQVIGEKEFKEKLSDLSISTEEVNKCQRTGKNSESLKIVHQLNSFQETVFGDILADFLCGSILRKCGRSLISDYQNTISQEWLDLVKEQPKNKQPITKLSLYYRVAKFSKIFDDSLTRNEKSNIKAIKMMLIDGIIPQVKKHYMDLIEELIFKKGSKREKALDDLIKKLNFSEKKDSEQSNYFLMDAKRVLATTRFIKQNVKAHNLESDKKRKRLLGHKIFDGRVALFNLADHKEYKRESG